MNFSRNWLGAALGLLTTVAIASEPYAPLSEIAIHPNRSAPATALSLNQATLSAQILAPVKNIAVGVSQKVAKGELLLELDCTDYRLALDTAEVALNTAQARLKLANSQKKRSDQLLGKQLTSQESADTAQVEAIARRGEFEQAKLARKKATVEVSRCQIMAPFDGIVVERAASVGQLATVGTALVSLVETHNMELSALIKPDQLEQLKQAKSLIFEANKTYPVGIIRLGGVVNSQTRNQEIRLAFNAARPAPGTAGKLTWMDSRPYVPADYVVVRRGTLGVFLAQNGKAKFVPLPGAIPGRPALATFKSNEKIITENLGQMVDGDAL